MRRALDVTSSSTSPAQSSHAAPTVPPVLGQSAVVGRSSAWEAEHGPFVPRSTRCVQGRSASVLCAPGIQVEQVGPKQRGPHSPFLSEGCLGGGIAPFSFTSLQLLKVRGRAGPAAAGKFPWPR